MTQRTPLTSSVMRRLTAALVTACGVAAGTSLAADSGFQVVVHADNPTPSLSRAVLAEIFLKTEEHRWSGGALAVPMDLAAALEAFSNAIHGKDASTLDRYWQRKIFSGKDNPPPRAATVEEVFEHIREHPGGVAYVPSGTALPDWVQVLEVTED